MFNFKKLGVLGLTVFASTSFIAGVKADEAYYRIEYMKKNEETVMIQTGETSFKPAYVSSSSDPTAGVVYFSSAFFGASESTTYNMYLVGHNLDDEKIYKITFGDDVLEISGADLKLGTTISTTEVTNGNKILKIVEKNNESIVLKYAVYLCDYTEDTSCVDGLATGDRTRFDTIEFEFPSIGGGSTSGGMYPASTPEEEEKLDAAFAITAPDGKVTFNTVEPSELTAMMGLEFLAEELNLKDGYLAYIDKTETGYALMLVDENGIFKRYDLTVVFTKKRNETYTKLVDTVVDKLMEMAADYNSDYSKRFLVEDLDSINYWYNAQKAKSEDAALLSMANYSSNLHKLANNINVDFMFRPGAGGDESQFTEQIIGMVDIKYDGDIYSSVDPVGFNLTNVIYIPDDTENDDASFKAAALKRINEYLKGVEVEITTGGAIADLDEGQNAWEEHVGSGPTSSTVFHELVDPAKTAGNWYDIKIGEETYKYFIVKDSSKMNKPYVKSIDALTNVYIMSDSYDVPLDSRVNVEKLDPKSDEYKKLAKNFKILDEMSYDIELFSTSLDVKIEKLSDGKFKVYVPIASKYKNSKLKAAYLKADGTKEYHEITIEGDYAVFETDHFSTYSIVTDGNPKTGDEIVLFVLAFTAAGYTLYKVKRFN